MFLHPTPLPSPGPQNGRTALEEATRSDNLDVVKYLVERGADKDGPPNVRVLVAFVSALSIDALADTPY
jgi:hypothetical protein